MERNQPYLHSHARNCEWKLFLHSLVRLAGFMQAVGMVNVFFSDMFRVLCCHCRLASVSSPVFVLSHHKMSLSTLVHALVNKVKAC